MDLAQHRRMIARVRARRAGRTIHRAPLNEIMEPVSKGQKLSVETDIKQCEDRISDLPPEIIGNILSLLPTKEAVATCVLAPRWKRYWTFISRLTSNADLVSPTFISFMYQFLYRKTTSFDYFSVSCFQMDNISHLRAWVSAALVIGVKELDLNINNVGDSGHVLPFDLFSCKKLVKLLVSGRFKLDVPAAVCLPSVEVLHLTGVRFRDEDSLKRLICGCPFLQKLHMTIEYCKVIHIAASTLSDLTVTYWGGDGVCNKLVLETPSLQYLKIDGMLADSYELADLNQLLEAHIDAFDFHKRRIVLTNLIRELSNVKTLSLSGSVMEVIIKSGCKLPKLQNVTTLKLGVSSAVGWALLPDLLENSPFLQKLVFEGLYASVGGRRVQNSSENAHWHAPQNVPYCLLHHLKVIQINHFKRDIEGEEMIRYFIENRGVLNELTIQYSGGSGELWDVIC